MSRMSSEWPRGWGSRARGAFADLDLGAAEASAFAAAGWSAHRAGVRVWQLEVSELLSLCRHGVPPVGPTADLGVALTLQEWGITPQGDAWDIETEAFVRAEVPESFQPDVQSRVVAGVDARLAVLLAAHDLGRRSRLMWRWHGTPTQGAAAIRVVSLGCWAAHLSRHRRSVAPSFWTVRPVWPRCGWGHSSPCGSATAGTGCVADPVSVCWYVASEIGLVESANDVDAGFTCLTALAAMGRTLDEVGFGDEEWVRAGTALLPSGFVPDRLVLAESSYEGGGQTPLDSDGTVFLIQIDGAYLFGGTDEMMGWTEVGPFVNDQEAVAWFAAETSEIGDNDEDGD